MKKQLTQELMKDSKINVSYIDGLITDHGGLSGLTDDDHSQYLLLDGRSGQILND